jgi:hypothetical protein
MKRVVGLLLIATALLSAQTPEKKYYQKVFDIKYADVNQLVDLLAFYPARVKGQTGLRAIAVGSDSEDTMKAIEEAIKRYDVPRGASSGSRNIEMTIYLLMAGKDVKAGDAVPADLDPVVRQLRSVFGYKDFELLDTAVLRNREGQRGAASGVLTVDVPNLDAAFPPTSSYDVGYANATVTAGEKGNVIRLDDFRLDAKIPYAVAAPAKKGEGGTPYITNYQLINVGFRTNLDVHDGQKVVVGKSKVDTLGRALIVVLTAKAVD